MYTTHGCIDHCGQVLYTTRTSHIITPRFRVSEQSVEEHRRSPAHVNSVYLRAQSNPSITPTSTTSSLLPHGNSVDGKREHTASTALQVSARLTTSQTSPHDRSAPPIAHLGPQPQPCNVPNSSFRCDVLRMTAHSRFLSASP